MTNEQIIKVVSAAIAGKPIESKPNHRGRPGDWELNQNPAWNFESFDYRVHREKNKPNTVPEIIELLQAERNKKPIECSALENYADSESGWLDKTNPGSFNFYFDLLRYRIIKK